MHPILFQVGGLMVNSYGVLIAIGFITSLALSVREGTRVGVSANDLVDLCFWVLVSGLLGGHLMFAVVNLPVYLNEPLRFLQFWRGGVVWYGGFLGGLAGAAIVVRRRGLNYWLIADVGMPGVTLGLFFGRFGCLSAGCCYGKPADLPWSVMYPGASQLAPPGVWLHPAPLYEALGLLVVYALLIGLRHRKRYHGHLLVWHLAYYAVIRFLLEMLRGDLERGRVLEIDLLPLVPGWEILSTSQVVSLVLLAMAVGIHLWRSPAPALRRPGVLAGVRRFTLGGA